MLQVRCPSCQSLLAFEDVMAGSVVACPDCAAELDVPWPLKTAADDDDAAVVRMIGNKTWILPETPLPIVVDGRVVAERSVKKGFDVVVRMAVGSHRVEIGPARHELEFTRPGYYEVEFEYSATWGRYSLPPKVRRVTFAKSGEWPTRRGDLESLGLEAVEADLAPQDQGVLAEVGRLQEQGPGWSGAVLLLVVSVILYGASQGQQGWEGLIILLPVLFFHELGHYLTMRAFGYRNLRMFFIPFFGAAVSGRHYNIAGWKKVVVALAGPLPGILLGVPIGIIGLILKEPIAVEVGKFMLILNGLNLLPFLPLDGGWVVHSILFVRHPVLDVVFRVIAALALLGLAILLTGWCLGALAVLMLLVAPMAYRLARIAHRLKQEGLVARSPDDQSIPPAAALQILAELRRSLPPQTPAKTLAQHVANVFEMFNAEPPGALASFLLLVLHASAFVTALVGSIILTVMQNPPG